MSEKEKALEKLLKAIRDHSHVENKLYRKWAKIKGCIYRQRGEYE